MLKANLLLAEVVERRLEFVEALCNTTLSGMTIFSDIHVIYDSECASSFRALQTNGLIGSSIEGIGKFCSLLVRKLISARNASNCFSVILDMETTVFLSSRTSKKN